MVNSIEYMLCGNDMTKRKFTSEFGLNMLPEYLFLLQQDDLTTIAQAGVSPHVYMIGRRPRISMKPNTMVFDGDRVSGVFQKQVKDAVIDIPFDVPNLLGTDDVTVNCEYPFTEVAVSDKGGNVISRGKCAALLTAFGSKYADHLDLEILYVGQAYGSAGDRTAVERLKSHGTLQGIYAEAMRRSPDQDIWLLLITFQEPMLISSFNGRDQNTEMTEEEDTAHRENVLQRVFQQEITEQQKINFTEAALIRYFQPQYNTVYKDSFPNPAHVTYSECYDIDLNLVSVEVATSDLGTRLWSSAVAAAYTHLCVFPLHSRQERVAMFDLRAFQPPTAEGDAT